MALAVSVPAGYALARLRLPLRTLIMIVFLLPQAFPSVAIYINVARVFYSLGLTGTIPGVVLVHAAHGLVYSVWIAAAAFAAVDRDLELAARNIGASPLRTFFTITLPLAAPGIMASAIFVFLESLDEFTGTFFVGVPQVTTLPLLLYNASMGGNYQIASITALILLVPSRPVHDLHRALPEGRRAEQGRTVTTDQVFRMAGSTVNNSCARPTPLSAKRPSETKF